MNKGMIVLWVLVASMSAGALAVGFMGPPTAELKQGQWNMGYNYTYSDMDLDRTTFKPKFLIEGLSIEGPSTAKVDIEDFKTQRHYFTVGYGLADWWELYAQVGGADVKAELEAEGESMGLNFDNDFAWGWGTRITLAEQDKVKWGVSAQMNWLDTDTEKKYTEEILGEQAPITEKWDIESFDLLVAFGPTVDMGCWKLYGGPFYYMFDGDFDITLKAFDVKGAVFNADMEEDSSFGGFIGAIFPLSQSMDWTTEFAATGDGWAIGTGLGWKF
jgi:hypothetical protein